MNVFCRYCACAVYFIMIMESISILVLKIHTEMKLTMLFLLKIFCCYARSKISILSYFFALEACPLLIWGSKGENSSHYGT